MSIFTKVLRRLPVFVLVLFLITLFGLQAFAINPQPEPPAEIQVIIDGRTLPLDTSPLIVEDRTLVPVRAIFEALGSTVEWIPDTQSVNAAKGNVTINLQIDNKTAYISGAPKKLDVPAMLYNDRTLVPLRFVGEALGAKVEWNEQNLQVIITTGGAIAPGADIGSDNTPNGSDSSPNTGTTDGTTPAPAGTTPSSPGLSGLVSIPDRIVTGLKEPLTSKGYDSAFIRRDHLIVKTIDPALLQIIQATFIPHQKDFSQYTTFTGNQDGWGGCIGRSMVHVMNIQNEMECPYTPDLSFWYMHRRQEQLANGGPVSTKYLLENYGLCAEASLPSDYDQATITNGVADFGTMPQPTAANDAEAAYYKADLLSEPITPDVDTMKKLMIKYGPLLIEGPFPAVQGANPQEGHCMTLVGWDDSHDGNGAFKILNSWGDYWNGNGFFWLKYGDLAANAQDVRYIKDGPSDRTGTQYAYSARINLQGGTDALRKQLTVKIGVTGQEPRVFWDQPNKYHCIDNSQNLCIDIPLPAYAAGNWPPSLQKHWYIEVTNEGAGSYTLQEFTLARQYKNAQGKLAVETFSFPSTGAVVNGHT
ncbi:MAG: stalk domain-containing protein, partial [Desulfatirhabdiaceae bacterium]